jgi:type I restriction enzyme M protein
MSEDQKKILEQQLWNIANTLRGKMNADEFRDYILGFIFYKYLSERMDMYANSILKADKIKYKDIKENSRQGKEYIQAIREESLEKLGYFLKPSELFSEVAKRGNSDKEEDESNFILEDLQKILTNIQQSTMGTESEEDFDHLFEDMDLNSTKLGKTPEARNAIIAKVLSHLDKIDFKLEQTELDVLGDAYEYLIAQFASGAGKKAGEFYTPQEVSMVLAKIVTTGKQKLKSVYDPTCGSGSLLLRVAKEVKEVSTFYGQELNRTTYNLARMNMILHGVHYRKFDIKQEDTLEHPQHIDKTFEAIVANPPFSAKWSANPLFMSDDRFSQYGKLAPASKADFAFVQHMLFHLAENGIMGIVLPHGVLYRGGSENHILRYLIENKNYLDAVIGLPDNLFYGTTYATCILVFKKCREAPDNVLFVDASNYYEKIKKQNVLRQSDIDRIIDTYRNRKEIPNYSRRISIDEIKRNDFNLNLPRYIDNFEKEDMVDLDFVCDFLKRINEHSIEADKKLKKICGDLKIPMPEGNNIELLKLYQKGIMQKIFSQQIRFGDLDGGKFQKWKSVKFGEVYTFKSNNSYSRENLNYEYGAIKNIHYGDIHTKFNTLFDITNEVVPYINPSINTDKIDPENFCKEGDLILADASEDYADVGKCIELVNLNNEKVVSGLHTILARPTSGILFSGFGGYMMKSSNVRMQIQKIAQGTKVLGISPKRLANLNLSIPCIEEQRKIVELLSLIQEKISFSVNQIQKIEEYKKQLTLTVTA